MGKGEIEKNDSNLQITRHDRDGLPTEYHPLSSAMNVNHSAPFRRLIADEFVLLQLVTPVRAKTAMRGTGHGILGYARLRGKETRDEIDPRSIASCGDDDSPRINLSDALEVRNQLSNGVGRFQNNH